MDSVLGCEWGVIVFGENNKGRITHEMMRSFADVFRQNCFELGLDLMHSPSFLFTKNIEMAQREVDEWLEELDSDKDGMLVMFFNDSDFQEMENKMQTALRKKALFYIQSGDSLLHCAHDKSDKVLKCWIREVFELLTGKFHRVSSAVTFEFGDDDGIEPPNVNVIETTERKTGSSPGEQEEYGVNKEWPLLDFILVENAFADLQNSRGSLKESNLIKSIDNPMLHNRLRIPYTKREQNGQLLALLSAASLTELPDLQTVVVNFVENILKSGFISFILRENAYCTYDVAVEQCSKTLFTYLQDIMQILYIAKVNHIQNFDAICDEFSSFVELIPENCWSVIDEELQMTIFRMLQKLIIDTSESMIMDLHEDHELNISDSELKYFDNRVSLDSVEERAVKDYRPIWINNDDVEPPEDFRTLAIYANSNDILHPVRPYIRRNIVQGSYSNQEHYLDVQFRLLREDFVAPLRDGICLWKQQKRKWTFSSYTVDPTEDFDLLIIRDVRMEGAQLKRSTGEIIRYATFQPISTGDSWCIRLKFGQLVTLSSDEFQDEALLATIVERDSTDFLEGKLGLCFFDDHKVSRAKIYTLVESKSYYEMYQHVLKCVKRFDSDHEVPFGRYLLKVETNVLFPAYLLQQIDKDSSSDSSSDSLSSEYTDYSGSQSLIKKAVIGKEISIFGIKYNVDKLKYTLDGDKVVCGLDNAQRNALCHALTHELTLIQGPPGTGKTFIGRLIVRILLENINIWNPARENPILVVCFTNHALDQFLDGVSLDLMEDGRYSNKLPNIVRMGSRCKSESLQKYTKRQIRDTHADLISDEVKYKASRVMLKRIHLLEMIRSQAAVLALRKKEILSFEHVQKVMLPEHIRQFKLQRSVCGKKYSADEMFSRWLLEGDTDREEYAGGENNVFGNENSDTSVVWSMDRALFKEKSEQKKEMIESAPKEDDWLVWKEIQERILKTDPDIDDYYHAGEWDLDKDPNAAAIKPVTVFSDKIFTGSKQVKCDAKLITRLKDVKANILKSSPITAEEASSIKNLETLHRHRRWSLYMHWINKLKITVSKRLDVLLRNYQSVMKDVKKEFDRLDEIVLRKALVIGATTTCAAKIRPFLDRLRCPIVIVEEAAEVLEAHVLTSIADKCQHAVLIGDHQQLRPNPAVFTLAREYDLDISLFERLIKNNFPCAVLEKQHRMAPLISNTVMPLFYPLIENGDNVFNYPDIKGCRKSLYFISHLNEEDMLFSTSHRNSFEGDFMVNLAVYFVQQGYTSSQITLLCTYTAQASYVKTQVALKFRYESPPLVETVDNYQGQENDIIILSLVRSKPSNGIGFLGVSNRMCVALSRSKLGFYVIGNMNFLRSKSHLWHRLYLSLAGAGCIGDSFPAFCMRHNVTQLINDAGEFLTKTPEGGCYCPCDFVRTCGHICSRRCHRTDPEHEKMCTRPCLKTCSTVFRHPCSKLCGESCGSCQSVESKTFPCGHTTDVVCYQFEKTVCQQKCQKKLPCGFQCVKKCSEQCKCSHNILLLCGHTATTSCSEEDETKCVVEVEKRFAKCGHCWMVPCHNYANALCGEKCEQVLPCGHRCQSLCGNCALDGCAGCVSLCGKRLPCGHCCLRVCGTPCEPCLAPCSNQCGHSCCGQQFDVPVEQRARCGDFCNFCVQRCMNRCKHQECQLQCWQVCNISPCNFSCDKKLECGHTCSSLCGEICPDTCAVCQGITVPILQFQGCKCVVNVREADIHMQKQTSRNEQYTCPKCSCKLSIYSCFRYARELKEQAIFNERIKFSKLLSGDLFVDLQYDILKQVEDNLIKIIRINGQKKNAVVLEIAKVLRLVISRLSTESYNNSGIVKWQLMVNMLTDMCQLAIYTITEKFAPVPKKLCNLRKLFMDSLGTTVNYRLLEVDLLNLSLIGNLLERDSPSVLEIPIANGLRKVSIKYMLGRLANECVRKLKDLNESQLNSLLGVTVEALTWSSDAKQKEASIRFVKCYRDLYESFNMQHMVVGDLRCMNFSC